MKTQEELLADIETEMRLAKTRLSDLSRNLDRAEVYMRDYRKGMKDEKHE